MADMKMYEDKSRKQKQMIRAAANAAALIVFYVEDTVE